MSKESIYRVFAFFAPQLLLGLEAKASLRSLSPETMMVPNLDLQETSGDPDEPHLGLGRYWGDIECVPSFGRIYLLLSLSPCLLSNSVSGTGRPGCRVSTESHQGPYVEFQVPV
jgi:hypothetical protein